MMSASIFIRLREIVMHMIVSKTFFLSRNPFVLEIAQLASTSLLCTVYNIFRFELLHELHLSVSKLLKDCLFMFIVSERVMSKPDGVERQRQPLSRLKVTILCGTNSLLAAIDQEAAVSGPQVDFSAERCSLRLDGLFLNRSVCELLDMKDHRTVDLESPNIETCIDRATGLQQCEFD